MKKEDGLDDEARGEGGTSVNEMLKEWGWNEEMTPETLLRVGSAIREVLTQCKEDKTKGRERKIKEEQEEVEEKEASVFDNKESEESLFQIFFSDSSLSQSFFDQVIFFLSAMV